jgi:hypothetical protein
MFLESQTADPTDQAAATQLLSNIPFGAIIGGPLVAGVEAQTQAANATLNYVLKVLFGDGVSNQNGNNTVMAVTFTFQRGASRAIVTVPLLTLVPIPYLLIETMDIEFKAQINANSSYTQAQDTHTDVNSSISGSGGFLFDKVNFNAGFSSKMDSSGTRDSKYSVEYTIDVKVHATGHDMPAGTMKVLNMLNDAILAVPADHHTT